MTTIPVSEFVNVQPNVLGAVGDALDLNGLMLSTSIRVPIGAVLSFASGAAVTAYFGAGSAEDVFANGGSGMGTGYFGGFEGSSVKPGAMLAAQYNQAAVAAYLRGGALGLTLAELQALSGSLTVVMDGYSHVISSINLSSYSSFSAAAAGIQAAFTDPTEASFTGQLGASFTGSQTGTTLTVASIVGTINVGDVIAGTGVAVGTTIVSFGTGTGGNGTYVTSVSGTAASAACTASSTVLDVTVCASPTIAVGQTLAGAGVTGSPLITAQLGGTDGGVGTYRISGSAQQVASEAMTGVATAPVVTYDSVSDAFLVKSGVTGTPSTAAFATGTLSASIKLTSATGAVVSQGAAAAVPGTFMDAIVVVAQNWATFATTFDPDGGSGNTLKLAFAAWANAQNFRYAYVCWDTDVTATESVPATGSLGHILQQNEYSGTALIYEPSDLNHAAFVCGAAASIDFEETNGRITFAYKSQSGLSAGVTTQTASVNLGGNPQVTGDFGNGYNYYGAVGGANANFQFFQRGTVSGEFRWLDSFLNQVSMTSAMQNALLTFVANARSIPYNAAGYSLIEQALAPVVAQYLAFGAFAPGSLSAAQQSSVNQDAGAVISGVLQTQGWYLQVLDPTASVRQSRGSPNMKFYYLDRGSVQAINLASVAVQ